MKNKKLLLFLALVIAILFMTVGYASIDSITGEITGNAIAKLQDGVFITDVEYVSDNEAKINSSKIEKFVGTMMKSTVELSDTNVDSSITYKVTVYNSYADTAVFSDVLYGDEFYDNTDITFEITGFKPGEKIGPSESKDIIITFKYSGTTVPSNNVLNSYLNFKITVPNRMVAGSKATNYLKGNIARNNIKKHKKTHLNKKRFATVIITGSLIVYGGVSMINDGLNAGKEITAKVDNRIEQMKNEYNLSKAKYSFTDYTEDQFNKLDYQEQVALYQQFIDFVQNSEINNGYSSLNPNYDKMRYDADSLAYELDMTASLCDENQLRAKKGEVLRRYKEIASVLKDVYKDKYTMTPVQGTTEIVHNINDSVTLASR